MKAIIQRVSRGIVSVDGKTVGAVKKGYVVLLGIKHGDTEANACFLADKTGGLRVFPDDKGKMNLSIVDIEGEVLVISQFTLYADTRKGNRPGFSDAAAPKEAERLYEVYVEHLRGIIGNDRVATGIFRAAMSVELVNEGPVTIEISSDGR